MAGRDETLLTGMANKRSLQVKIDAAEIRYVELPLISPWRTAYGEDATIHSVMVKLSGGGTAAWGEATPFYAPTYSS